MKILRENKKTIKVVIIIIALVFSYIIYSWALVYFDSERALRRLRVSQAPSQTYVNEKIMFSFDMRKEISNYRLVIAESGGAQLLLYDVGVINNDIVSGELVKADFYFTLFSYITPTGDGIKYLSLHELPPVPENPIELAMTTEEGKGIFIEPVSGSWTVGDMSGSFSYVESRVDPSRREVNSHSKILNFVIPFDDPYLFYESVLKQGENVITIELDGYYIVEYKCSWLDRLIMNDFLDWRDEL